MSDLFHPINLTELSNTETAPLPDFDQNINQPISPYYYHKKFNGITYSCYDMIECITSDCKDNFSAFLIGNIIKYLWRYQYKGGKNDLLKAREYLARLTYRFDVLYSQEKTNGNTEQR